MKKRIAWILALLLTAGAVFGCTPADPESRNESDQSGTKSSIEENTKEETEAPTEAPTEEPTEEPFGKDMDLRGIVVDYMKRMASVEWTASTLIDYSSNSKSLVYKPGQKYLGMVYNNNATGLEKFLSILDENAVSTETNTSWNESPGNSCATSIRHAYQQVSADVEYGYSFDMLPFYENTGIIAIGNIDWSQYNGTNTLTTVFAVNDRDDLLEAYALMKPGDSLVRYIDTGGHAQMITKDPFIVRTKEGKIDPENSYLYISEQNNLLNNTREYPSSWKWDYPVSFATAQNGSYLPVTIEALVTGVTKKPEFETSSVPTAEDLAGGTIKGNVKCNYCMNEVKIEVLKDGEPVISYVTYPYARSFGLKTIRNEIGLKELEAGSYTFVVTAAIGFGTEKLMEIAFTK